ncbi:hypothetical protein [Pseudarthrobacter sp. L1SW]|uniref:hypothetical protein n=1 Tax=Pseudarthrobacter sp. L1SW TaxID=2851598 RepID=UPI001E5A9246|nr:hypothetical protein [Pseudarthrobacter sp. L1SW]UEL29498.1 hypothetical protein KTR40_05080 [Pseudarthrobacter sp. L1SW]
MNRMTRFVLTTGAGLALALTASPALAAPPSDSPGNPAQVGHVEYSYPNGASYEYRGVARVIEEGYYTTNSRDQMTVQNDDGTMSTFDYKTHYMLNQKVTKMNSTSTFTEDGETCRNSSQTVTTNGETRMHNSQSDC